MDTVTIRKSKWKLYETALLGGLLIIYYFIGLYEYTRSMYADSPKLTIAIGILFFLLFISAVSELITRKGELIFTEDGLEIRDEGWNHWEYIQSFRTLLESNSENGDKKYLIVQLKDLNEIKYDASELDESFEEIGFLMKKFKPAIEYKGHLER
jgi:hypothetical protein